MGKRVLLITQWFDPEPTFKGLLFAKELTKQGFSVEVVTGFPNYPGGKVYDGYKVRWLQRDVIDGVRVNRLPLYPAHDSSALKRVLNYVSFAASSLFYCLFMAKRADVIYAYHPPLTIGVVAVITRFFRRVPVVYDIQDMWPDTLRSTGMLTNEKVLSFIGWVASWVYKRVDQLVVLSPGFKRLLIERGVPAAKIEVIPNWCDEKALTETQPLQDSPFTNDGRLRVVFAGNMGKAQALDVVIESAAKLQQKKANVVFYMIGGGLDVDRLELLAIEKGLNNIVFLPQVPMIEVGSYLSQADVLLVHLKKDDLFKVTIPSKIQAYMYMGKAILLGVEGDSADIIIKANAGFIFEPGSYGSLVDAIELLTSKTSEDISQYGQRGKRYYLNNLSLKSGVEKFTKVFEKISIKRVYILKTLFDYVLSFISLPLLIPVLFIVGVIIKLKFGSPVFFSQVRPGLDGKPFKMVKFRTMENKIDANGNLLPDADRITPFGSFLRASSLDELPELWNVLKGDMSLVGPRPLLMEYLPLYTSKQMCRHKVKPGITGWAQVNGRNAISWEEKFKMDVWYVDNQSLLLDIKILWLTIKKVITRDGISAEGEATMPKFRGSSR